MKVTTLNEYAWWVRDSWAEFPVREGCNIYGLEGRFIAATGLAEEAGEVLGKLKKEVRDGLTNSLGTEVLKELGDTLFYLTKIADFYGWSLQDVANAQIQKVLDRRTRGTLNGSGDDR